MDCAADYRFVVTQSKDTAPAFLARTRNTASLVRRRDHHVSMTPKQITTTPGS